MALRSFHTIFPSTSPSPLAVGLGHDRTRMSVKGHDRRSGRDITDPDLTGSGSVCHVHPLSRIPVPCSASIPRSTPSALLSCLLACLLLWLRLSGSSVPLLPPKRLPRPATTSTRLPGYTLCRHRSSLGHDMSRPAFLVGLNAANESGCRETDAIPRERSDFLAMTGPAPRLV